jgi:uncharacterized membrane protein YeaQ/YmgE (transglycosylase-associated protein family)
MGLISWLVIGAIAGLVARRIVPGTDPGRFIVTVILGIGGASLGGFTMGVLGGSGTTSFDVWTVLVATLGAVMLLYLYGLIVRRIAWGESAKGWLMMNASLTKILLATDGSRDATLAMRAAADVSCKTGAQLHVVHVFPDVLPPANPGSTIFDEDSRQAEEEARELLRKQGWRARVEGGEVAGEHSGKAGQRSR